MGKKRKQYESAIKAKAALEAIKGQKTMAEIASIYGVHANQISKWKKKVLTELPGIFSRKSERDKKEGENLQAELYQQIGQLKVELDWLKKKSGLLS